MNTCPNCERETGWRKGATLARYTVGAKTFTANVPARFCKACEKPIVAIEHMEALEREAAQWIAHHGYVAPITFRLLRKMARLSGKELATLLGTNKETVSRWETGDAAFNRGTWATVAELASESMAGRTGMRDRLRGSLEPRIETSEEILLTSLG